MELDLEVFWHSKETKKLDDSGMDYGPDDLETKTLTFYNIDVISPFLWKENWYCKIFACGDNWISPYTYEEVRQMISDAKKQSPSV